MNDKTYKLTCTICGGINIETKVWVDANDDVILDSCSDGDIEDNWCRDCEKHVYFKVIESDKLKRELE